MACQAAALTALERTYIDATKDAIIAVCNVECYITAAHATQLDWCEAQLTEQRIAELKAIAERELNA